MLFPLVLKAFANPFAGGLTSLCKEGRGHAYVPVVGVPGRVHGATDNHVEAKRRGTRCLEFDGAPFDVGANDMLEFAHYRQQFHDGVLVAADADTAKLVGLKFVEPKSYIDACRDAACAAFKAEFGRDAWASKEAESKRAAAKASAAKKEDAPVAAAELPSPPLPAGATIAAFTPDAAPTEASDAPTHTNPKGS